MVGYCVHIYCVGMLLADHTVCGTEKWDTVTLHAVAIDASHVLRESQLITFRLRYTCIYVIINMINIHGVFPLVQSLPIQW